MYIIDLSTGSPLAVKTSESAVDLKIKNEVAEDKEVEEPGKTLVFRIVACATECRMRLKNCYFQRKIN